MTETTAELSVSFIIPALDEEAQIGGTISSIHQYLTDLYCAYEVIVVDNGSNDSTVAIAKELGAIAFVEPTFNISELRNHGVKQSRGNVLVFLDADISLTEAWGAHVAPVLKKICTGEKLVTGSHCAPPESDNLLLAHWFKGLYEDTRNTHLGSAHMIMSRLAFNDIDGFNAKLSTGEDYDFCQRAGEKGYKIENNIKLKVIHYDFPTSILPFIQREAWHGSSDFYSFSTLIGSKVAIATVIFIGLHVLLLLVLVIKASLAPLILLLILALLVVSSITKFGGQNLVTIFVNACVFYFYFVGRALSAINRK